MASTGLLTSVLSVPGLIVAFVVIAATALIYPLFHREQLPPNAPQQVSGGLPLVGALDFFFRRHAFFRDAIAKSKSGHFTFWVGNVPVVGVSGPAGRKLYFESRQLSMAEGYARLFAGGPSAPPTDGDVPFDTFFHNRINAMLKGEAFRKMFPRIMNDTLSHMRGLAASATPTATTNPFDSVYLIIFHLTVRMLGCDEIADDPAKLRQVLNWYEMIESGTDAISIITPWIPTLSQMRRNYAGLRLYLMLKGIADERKRTGTRRDDALQLMLDHNDPIAQVVAFIVGALFAGLLNSGINAARVLVYLGLEPAWRERARAEVLAMAARHAPDPSAPLLDQLAAVPLAAWESELPLSDAALKDSIRINLHGSGFRRNMSTEPLPIPGSDEVVPPGAYVAMHFQGHHLDPAIWPEPEKWDPARYAGEQSQERATPFAWAGFGAGRHPCLGMRFAKLEQSMIMAMWIACFDFDVRDAAGEPLKEAPKLGRQLDNHAARKPTQEIFLNYSVREKSI